MSFVKHISLACTALLTCFLFAAPTQAATVTQSARSLLAHPAVKIGGALLAGYVFYRTVVKPWRNARSLDRAAELIRDIEAKAEAEVRNLLKRVNPHIDTAGKEELAQRVWQELARGGVQANGKGGYCSWSENPYLVNLKQLHVLDAKELACMLAGTKHVSTVLAYQQKRIFSSELVLNTILQRHAIATVSYQNRESTIILYTPTGKNNALLLIKNSLLNLPDLNVGCYIKGLLLGYRLEDIEAFFIRTSELYRPLSPDELEAKRKELSALRHQAQAWIKENSPTIEQWITENASKYTITFS